MTNETEKELRAALLHETLCVEAAKERIATLEAAYNELLMSVANAYEGETRHQTALRYIREREYPKDDGPSMAPNAALSRRGGGQPEETGGDGPRSA